MLGGQSHLLWAYAGRFSAKPKGSFVLIQIGPVMQMQQMVPAMHCTQSPAACTAAFAVNTDAFHIGEI